MKLSGSVEGFLVLSLNVSDGEYVSRKTNCCRKWRSKQSDLEILDHYESIILALCPAISNRLSGNALKCFFILIYCKSSD